MNLELLDLDAIEYGFGVTFGTLQNVSVFCPYCEDEQSKSLSCSVSRDGLFKCHGKCGTSGTVVDFLGKTSNLLPYEAEEALSKRDPIKSPNRSSPTVAKAQLDDGAVRDMIERAHMKLAQASSQKRDRYWQLKQYLNDERGLSDRTITVYEIGADEHRLTIPVYWGDETPGIRQYLPHAPKGRKIKYNPRAVTTTRIYPYRVYESLIQDDVSEDEFVILCEGEWDCLLLLQNGYKALTTTAGVQNWKDEWYDMITDALRGRRLVIMFDVNDKNDLGQRMARRRAVEFTKRGVESHIVELPLTNRGGDVTDYFVKYSRSRAELDQLIQTSLGNDPVTLETFDESDMSLCSDEEEDGDDDPATGLIDALQDRNTERELSVQALVVAKSDAPYRVPCHWKVSWGDAAVETRLKPNDPRYLALLGIDTTKQLGLMKAWASIPVKARQDASVAVYEYSSVEELFISPVSTDMRGVEDRQVPPAYSIGLGIAPNTVYRFSGVLTPRPKDQHSCFLFNRARIEGMDIDEYDLANDDIEQMARLFSTADRVASVTEKMNAIADEHAHHRTMVYGRNDLHTMIDLAYHSPLRFGYGHERNIRGRLDVGIFGDTRTGKSQAAERMQQFYGLGSTMLCENKATASGIMGGVNRINGTFVLKPGRIPLAHRRLLICDEMNQLSKYEIGNLTGTRSSGEVRIEKIVHGVFPAETRLVWLSNPREEDLDSYCYGIEMLKDLIGDSADIARFDAVLIIAAQDVSRDVIQAGVRSSQITDPSAHRDLYRKLVLWVWSRRTDQTIFTSEAVEHIHDSALKLSKTLHPSLPLMLEAEARHKIARFAAATAARLFSTDDGESIVVRSAHVRYAEQFLTSLYEKPSCGFFEYSATRFAEEVLVYPNLIDEFFRGRPAAFHTLSSYVLSTRELSRDGLMIAAGLDHLRIFEFMHTLQKCGAIRPGQRSVFVRTKAFKNYLTERLEKGATKDGTTPQE